MVTSVSVWIGGVTRVEGIGIFIQSNFIVEISKI